MMLFIKKNDLRADFDDYEKPVFGSSVKNYT